jgi:hypothetical protein
MGSITVGQKVRETSFQQTSQAWRCLPVILAKQEAQVGGFSSGQSGHECRTLCKNGWGCGSGGEHLPSQVVKGLNSRTTKKSYMPYLSFFGLLC